MFSAKAVKMGACKGGCACCSCVTLSLSTLFLLVSTASLVLIYVLIAGETNKGVNTHTHTYKSVIAEIDDRSANPLFSCQVLIQHFLRTTRTWSAWDEPTAPGLLLRSHWSVLVLQLTGLC